MRIVRRGMTSVEELEKVEKEEAERKAVRATKGYPPYIILVSFDVDFINVWDSIYTDVPLSPSVIATWIRS